MTLLSFVPLLSFMLWGFPSLFIVSDRLCLILKCSVGSFQVLWLLFCIHSVSLSGSGRSIVCCTQTPPGAPGGFNSHLDGTLPHISFSLFSGGPIISSRTKKMCVAPQLRSLWCVWKCWISFWLRLYKMSQGQRFEMKTQASGFKMKDKGLFSWVTLMWIHF